MPKGYDDTLCLNCCIPVCDDGHPQCFYKIWREAEKSRKEYWRAYYLANRETILAKARERKWKRLTKHQRYHRKNREKRNQYLREYRARMEQV